MASSTNIRWQQRLENLQSAYQTFLQAANANDQDPSNRLMQLAVIKAFEMAFELSCNTRLASQRE